MNNKSDKIYTGIVDLYIGIKAIRNEIDQLSYLKGSLTETVNNFGKRIAEEVVKINEIETKILLAPTQLYRKCSKHLRWISTALKMVCLRFAGERGQSFSKCNSFNEAFPCSFELLCTIERFLHIALTEGDWLNLEETSKKKISKNTSKAGNNTLSKDVFISYSHKDKEWLDRILKMLKPDLRRSSISIWSDQDLKVGSSWRDEIDNAIKNAKVAILLVSGDFLDSDFIDKNELPPIFEKDKNNTISIFWIPIKFCRHHKTRINDYHAAYDPSTPLYALETEADQDYALREICGKLLETLLNS